MPALAVAATVVEHHHIAVFERISIVLLLPNAAGGPNDFLALKVDDCQLVRFAKGNRVRIFCMY